MVLRWMGYMIGYGQVLQVAGCSSESSPDSRDQTSAHHLHSTAEVIWGNEEHLIFEGVSFKATVQYLLGSLFYRFAQANDDLAILPNQYEPCLPT